MDGVRKQEVIQRGLPIGEDIGETRKGLWAVGCGLWGGWVWGVGVGWCGWVGFGWGWLCVGVCGVGVGG